LLVVVLVLLLLVMLMAFDRVARAGALDRATPATTWEIAPKAGTISGKPEIAPSDQLLRIGKSFAGRRPCKVCRNV
jgi:hypothetical protein